MRPVFRRMAATALAGMILWLASSSVRAQTGSTRSQLESQPGDREFSPGELQGLFDAYIVMQAQQRLALNEAQYPKFLTRLRTLQETRRRNQEERLQLIQGLSDLVSGEPRADDQTLRERLRALQEQESRSAAELRKAYDSLDEVLEVRQQARFRVFEEQMERRKLQLLLRARQGGRIVPRSRLDRPPV